VVRWAHAAAAATLVGSSAFALLVLRPMLRQGSPTADLMRKPAEAAFKEVVDLCLVVFVLSGGLLTFERLSSGAASTLYVGVLGLKVLLSALLYRWAFQVSRGRGWDSSQARLLVASGFLVLLLAALLKTLYEAGLRS
jgi:hypothetical protein